MDNKIVYVLLPIALIFIKIKSGGRLYIDFLLTPILIFCTVNLLYDSVLHKLFILLGENSTNMWLTHSFFCYTYFQWLVFKPRISIIILVLLVILSLAALYFVNYIKKWCTSFVSRFKVSLSK